MKGGANGAADRLQAAREHPADLRRQRLAVLLGHLQLAARLRILIAAAELHEQRGSAGMRFLQLCLGEAGVVAVDLVEVAAQRGAVAGIAEQDGAERAIGGRDLEDGNVRVGRAARVDAEADALRGRLAPVDGESGPALAVREHGGLEVAEGRADGAGQVLGELLPVLLHAPSVLGVQVVHGRKVGAHHRASVRVRGIEDQAGALQPVLLLDARRHHVGDGPGQADQIGGHEYQAPAPAVLQRQRLEPEVQHRALGGVVPAGVAGEPDRLLGGDPDAGHARLEIGRGQ